MSPTRVKRRVRTADRAARMGPAEALVGRLLCGKWRVDGLLNSGGTASVYSATHRNGRRVAVKVLRPELSADARMKRRFLREGYLANRVGHPGAVCVLDDDTDGEIVFLVMELLEGTDLARLSREGMCDASEVAFWVDGLLDVVAAAHASGIIHRDVKPSNVLLTTKGEIRLLDFGIARIREPSDVPGDTRSGAVLGTPGFMAPEQARARRGAVDARTDIWAVGATMFRLLTGRIVHEAPSGHESMIAAATLPAPPIKTVRADLPDALADMVDRALRFEAAGRWQDAKEMQIALWAIRSELPPYEWRGISPADAASGERTVDASCETPTTSSHEESPSGAARFEALRSPRRRLFVSAVFAAGIAVVPLVASLRARTDAQAAVGARPESSAAQDAVTRERPGRAALISAGRSDGTVETGDPAPGGAGTRAMKSEAPARPARAIPRSVEQSSERRPAAGRPAVSPPSPAIRPGPSGTVTPPLEEFLNERK